MSVIKHSDTYVCDICGAEFTERRSVNVPVVWTTEQTEGRFCEPYYGVECLDLCEECVDKVHVVEAAGEQGLNSYIFRKRAERTCKMIQNGDADFAATLTCSVCGNVESVYAISADEFNYCPNCGAKVVE